jgi:hypothetical protein
MSNLVEHAERELDFAGIGDEDADYDGALKPAVLAIIKVFAEQGHSGASAAMTTAMVGKLMRFEPLTPLTGADEEWVHLHYDDHIAYQNKRCSHVFKDADGRAYDIDGIVREDPSGSRWQGSGSNVDVTFPYTPKTEVVHIDWHGRALDGSGRDLPGFCDDDGCGCWREGSSR